MPLPRAEQAVVEPRKVRDYLLSSSHPLGRFKAAFFDALGYAGEDWGALVADLRRHAVDGVVATREATPYGEKYRVRDLFAARAGRTPTSCRSGLSFMVRTTHGS